MALNEQTYKKLKQEVDTKREEAQRARGALDTLMTRLKDEFDCEDAKSARTLLATLEGKVTKAEREFDRQLADYQKKWNADEAKG